MRHVSRPRTSPVGIENIDGRYVVIDCHSSHPEMAVIYEQAFKNILRIADMTDNYNNYNPSIIITCMLRAKGHRMLAALSRYQNTINNNPGAYADFSAAITLLDNVTGKHTRLDPVFISVLGSPIKIKDGVEMPIRLEGTERKPPSVMSIFGKIQNNTPISVVGALPDVPASEWLAKAFSKPLVHLFDPHAVSEDGVPGTTYTAEFVAEVTGLSYQDSIACKNQIVAWPEGRIPMRVRLTSSGMEPCYADLTTVSPLYVKTVGHRDGTYSTKIILRGTIVNVGVGEIQLFAKKPA